MIPDPQRPKSQEYLFHMERPSNLTSPIEQPQAKPHMYKVLFIETFLYVRCRTRFLFFFFEAFAALVNLIPFDIVLQTSAVLTMREVTLLPSVISAKSFVKRRGKKKKKRGTVCVYSPKVVAVVSLTTGITTQNERRDVSR